LTRGLTWKVLLPAVAAIAGSLLAAVPWLVWTLERDQIATLASRLAGAAREAGTVCRGPQVPTSIAPARHSPRG
jgi:hypothetical protein